MEDVSGLLNSIPIPTALDSESEAARLAIEPGYSKCQPGALST